MQGIGAWEKRLEERLLEHYAAINDNVEKVARLERMVFLLLSIMNGTTFASSISPSDGLAGPQHPATVFADQLEELWRLQGESEG